jgi:D-beta-D-heptose 7-phosphate kinase/D-beta-D-heptose 1-phosphate adenosyltransferase
VKERFIGRAQGRHPHQILRVDSEVRDPLSPELETRLAGKLLEVLPEQDIVLISDYDKGVCTPKLLRLVIDHCRSAGVPVLVDPIRGCDYSRYRGATSMTPNRTEAGMATGITIETADDALRAGRKLCRELKLDMAIVTLDRDGMALVHPDGSGEVFPTRPRAVYDITGAGDMVLSMIGLCLASGLDAPDAIKLGNIAGGLEVEKVGVAVIPRAEIRARLLADRPASQGKLVGLEQLCLYAASHRALGQRVVLANGCFDLLHVGHVKHLQQAAQQGDVLVVALNADASVRRLKGAGRPVINQYDRAAMLSALACVEYVTVFDEATPIDVIRALRPDVLVKGGNYRRDEVVGHEFVASYGGEVCVTPMVEGVSTSNIVTSVRSAA